MENSKCVQFFLPSVELVFQFSDDFFKTELIWICDTTFKRRRVEGMFVILATKTEDFADVMKSIVMDGWFSMKWKRYIKEPQPCVSIEAVQSTPHTS